MKKVITLIIAALMCLTALCACSKTDSKLNFGKEFVPAGSQLDVLVQLNAKSVDVGIMDSIMAKYYTSQDSKYASALTVIDGVKLTTEQYGIANAEALFGFVSGIAARKGSALIYYINNALVELSKDGALKTLADKFGIASDLCIDESYTAAEPTDTSDWDYIKQNGKLIIGYTLFAPIAYEDGSNLTCFDVELARLVCAKLGIEPEFVIINWDTKENSLKGKSIDCIWNGLTIDDDRKAAMEISIPYLNNNQVAVIRKEDAGKYKSTADMKDAIIAAESGSAGEACVVPSEE